MKNIIIILILIILIVAIEWILLALYCRIQYKLDKKKTILKKKQGNNQIDSFQKRSVLKKIYHFINGYLYGFMRYKIIRVGHIPSHMIRNVLYRLIFGMKITKNTVIHGGCEIRSPWNIQADSCIIHSNCILDGRNGIKIGQNVVLGSGVHIWTEEHDVDDEMFGISEAGSQPVIIEDRAWICSDSTILPGVKIGEGAVLASKAVATKDCECFTVNAGIPAKKIKARNMELKYELSGKPHWHFW